MTRIILSTVTITMLAVFVLLASIGFAQTSDFPNYVWIPISITLVLALAWALHISSAKGKEKISNLKKVAIVPITIFLTLVAVWQILEAMSRQSQADNAANFRAAMVAVANATATAEAITGTDAWGYPLGTGEVDCRGLRNFPEAWGNCTAHNVRVYNLWDKQPELAPPGYIGLHEWEAERQACIKLLVQKNGGLLPDPNSPEYEACWDIIPHP